MKRILISVTLLMCCVLSQAQQAVSTNNSPIPALVNFSGVLTDVNGKPLTGVVGVTFYLYQEQQGGSPLWIETQNVQPNINGQYSVMLGSTTSSGLPANLFVAGEARWLGVQAQGQPEQPRVMLLSVPYAMKAQDAETIGRLPPSAFALATPAVSSGNNAGPAAASGNTGVNGNNVRRNASSDVTTTGGTVNAIPLFSTTTNIQNSILTQTGTSAVTAAGNLTASGVVTGSSFQIGSNLFAYGSYANGNAFTGFAGNTTMTGEFNTAVGFAALGSDTTGSNNAAGGYLALHLNTTGSDNTASGYGALSNNTTGAYNAASGFGALADNTTGGENVGVGYAAGYTADSSNGSGNYNTALGAYAEFSTGSLSNAAAIGSQAEVGESNALVLGCVSGVNNCPGAVNVGIGTTTPGATLDVEGNAAAATAPFLYLKNQAKTQSGSTGNSVEIGFQPDSGGVVTNPNAYIRAQEDGNGNYGTFISFGTVTDNGSGSTERLRITANGNVGIGTTSPDNLLSVNGSADKPGGGSWGTYSDRRLKNLDGSFSSGLSEVMKINPVKYRYKDDNGMGIRDRDEHVGVVAQEIQKAIPEAVTENSRGYLMVNNDPVIWAMLNAIKEQQKLIQRQEQRIAQLSSQVRAIQASLQTNGRTGSEIRTVKAQVPMVRQ
jgi:Chaperone of endosialidase